VIPKTVSVSTAGAPACVSGAMAVEIDIDFLRTTVATGPNECALCAAADVDGIEREGDPERTDIRAALHESLSARHTDYFKRPLKDGNQAIRSPRRPPHDAARRGHEGVRRRLWPAAR
jgi:hypothetical protein